MAWLEAKFQPGFSVDLTQWRIRISTKGRMEVFVNGKRIHREKLSPNTFATLLSLEPAFLQYQNRPHRMDDASAQSITITNANGKHTRIAHGLLTEIRPRSSFFELWSHLFALGKPHVDAAREPWPWS